MNETKSDPELEPEPDPEPTKEPVPELEPTKAEDPSGFEIETLDDLQRVLIMAQGGNPDAQQTLNDFLRFGDNIERTNLPKREDVQRMIFADYAGKTLYPDYDDDPFTKFANSMATSFMAKGGDKSKQFVELMKQTPSLSDLQTIQEQPQSIMDRLLRRGKEE